LLFWQPPDLPAFIETLQKIDGDGNQKKFGVVSNGKLWEFGVLHEEMFTKTIKYYGLANIKELLDAGNFLFVESAAIVMRSDMTKTDR
jgi:hypothetical protein